MRSLKERTFLIITFCGHAEVGENKEILRESVLSVIESNVGEEDVVFYLGGYGDFDGIAQDACKVFQLRHPSSRLVFVTPYLDQSYLDNRAFQLTQYDEIVFPEIENCLPKYAISKRNEWLVRKSDLVIAYVNYGWGGAAKTLTYAKKKGKLFINLGKKVFS